MLKTSNYDNIVLMSDETNFPTERIVEPIEKSSEIVGKAFKLLKKEIDKWTSADFVSETPIEMNIAKLKKALDSLILVQSILETLNADIRFS